MRPLLSVLRKDMYKAGHPFQYPKDTEMVYSNLTARGSRVAAADGVIAFGFQYWVQAWLIDDFNRNFFNRSKDSAIRQYSRRMANAIGPLASYDHIAALHDLGYLPICVKAVPEGLKIPLRVPLLTIRNTHPAFSWLTNMLETNMSSVLWRMITSATTAFGYRTVFEAYAKKTGASKDFVKWQGHDFSMRGLDPEAAIRSGAAHLISFTGTDTIPAIDFLEDYYGADCEKELIGGSVAATEHSVMCMGGPSGEEDIYRRLLTEVYPTGVVSVVSDTYSFWDVLTKLLPSLKEVILSRDGKLVIRPDSGDPVKIICGDPSAALGSPERAGAIRLLYKVFGGTKNLAGFIELDPHIGLIYGDSITQDRQEAILGGLAAAGFASSNVVLGIGSYTYQYVTRDTYGLAVKGTFAQVSGEARNIFKKPLTDDGTKHSAKGMIRVEMTPEGVISFKDGVSWADESGGILQCVFRDGRAANIQTLAEIRARIEAQL